MSQSFGMSTRISADHAIIPLIEKQFPAVLFEAVNDYSSLVAYWRAIAPVLNRSSVRRLWGVAVRVEPARASLKL